jgi:hypothetical protein
MKLEIVQILDRGKPADERLHLRALTDCDLKYFLVFATKYSNPTAVLTNPKFVHWFKTKPIKAGDTVVLYTKNGVASETLNPSGVTSHFLFWGLNSPIWIAPEDCAIVMEINTWATTAYLK